MLAVAAAQGDIVFNWPTFRVQMHADPIAVGLPFLHVALGVVAHQIGVRVVNAQFLKHFAPAIADVQCVPDAPDHHQEERQEPPHHRLPQQGQKGQGDKSRGGPDEDDKILAQQRPVGPEAELPIRGLVGRFRGPFVGHGRNLLPCVMGSTGLVVASGKPCRVKRIERGAP